MNYTIEELATEARNLIFSDITGYQATEYLTGAEIITATPMKQPGSYYIYFKKNGDRYIMSFNICRSTVQTSIAKVTRRRGAGKISAE